MPQATRAADFVDSIGVNTHFANGFEVGDQYGDAAKALEALRYLGIDLIRDYLPDFPEESARYDLLADAGIEFVMETMQGRGPQWNVDTAKAFLAAHPGSIRAIEGPNEIDNWAVHHNGLSGEAGAQSFQAELFRLVNADPALRDIPVYNFTTAHAEPDTPGEADYSNIHAYRPNGKQPSDGLSWHVDHMKGAMPGKPMVLTETGYYTAPTNNEWGGVDERSQAVLTLNTLFHADALGIKETHLYQLGDDQYDQSEANREGHFGLFDRSWNPKDAADAIRNLTAILKDAGAAAETFAPGSLGYTVSGSAPNLASKLMQKSDGTFQVAVWAEPDIWDENADRAIQAPESTITVKLDKAYASVKVFDPMTGTAAVSTASNTDTVTLKVTDHPLIVEVSGASGGGGGGTSKPLFPPVTPSAGSGPDALVLKIGQDHYQGSAQYTVSVDGKQVGGTFTASALHGSGQADTLTLKGDWAAGGHTVSVNFLNDAWDGTPATDRNLYVESATYNGVAVQGAAKALMSAGAQGFSFTDAGGTTQQPVGSFLQGTAGADSLAGGTGADRLRGLGGDDSLTGGAGNDALNGGAGADRLDGGAGNDYLLGGQGADVLTGGAGPDRFAFAAAGEGGDTIADFSLADGDRLDLRGVFATPGQNYAKLAAGGFAKATAVSGGGVQVWVDANGGGDGYVAVAKLNGLTLAALGNDFLIA